MSKLPKLDLELYRQSMETNYMGTVNAISAVLPAMVAQGKGHIALIASVAGYRGLPNGAPYAPTKAALINLAECIRPSLLRLGITVSVINPGFVETPMTAQNKFKMPFLLQADEAARRIIRGLERRKYEIAFPAPIVILLKFLRLLPNSLFFLIAERMMPGRK
jgi:short-subunit dehydrogenase